MWKAFFSKAEKYPLSLSLITLTFVSGALLAVLRTFALSSTLVVLMALIGIVGGCVRYRAVCACAWCLLGFSWAAWSGNQMLDHWLPASMDGKEQFISGYIVDFARPTDDGWQFDFYNEQLAGIVRLSIPNTLIDSAPLFSCRYQLQVKLKRPRGLLNNGQYDYQAWLLQAGYVATGYVKTISSCETYRPSIFLRWRQAIADDVRHASVSHYAAGTLSALLIGNYADINVMQWRILRDSGTIHLLSVSGLHIVLVVLLFHWIMTHGVKILVFPLRYWPAEHWASVASLCFAVFYALLTGFSVATQRSLIMVSVAVIQRVLYGRFRLSLIFLLSLLLVVIANPLSMLSASFWFTYVATGILLLTNVNVIKMHMPRWKRWLIEPIRLQIIMFFVMLPVLLSVYGRISWLSLPLNFLAVPWVSFISLPCAFFSLALMPFSSEISSGVLGVAGWTLDVYWWVMQYVLQICHGNQFFMGEIAPPTLLLAVFGASLLCFLPRRLPLRYLSLLFFLPLLLPLGISLGRGVAEVHVLDVGQGLSIIVRTQHHTLVYDTGDKLSERFDAGRDIVATALRNLRIDAMDMLLISHADSDHAGGRQGLLDEIPAKQWWSGTPEKMHDHEYLPCSAGMHWQWDGVDFRVLYPFEQETENSNNNRSCVVRIDAGGQRVLLAGDIEALAEQALLVGAVDLRADILVAPHHGSKTSSSAGFLDAVGAKAVIVSSGFGNRFHHPASSVVRRYNEKGMQLINTAESGAVRMQLVPGKAISTSLALCTQAKFWRADRYNMHCTDTNEFL